MPPDSLLVRSPDGRIEVSIGLIDGIPHYSLARDGTAVILPSRLGFTFLNDPPFDSGLRILDLERSSHDQTWTQPWGEVKTIRDRHNELRVTLTDGGEAPRQLVIVFRLFDDGLGFRYEFPEQPNLDEFQIMDEHTEIALSGNGQSWWIPAFQPNRYEYLYRNTSLSQFSGSGRSVHTPFTLQTEDGLYLSIHEAALVD
jgi:alpha-glucosidase